MLTKKSTVVIALLACVAPIIAAAEASDLQPKWLEADSALAIQNRIRSDFSLSYDSAARIISEKYPQLGELNFEDLTAKHYIESMNVDGKNMIFRKSPRNIGLLNPALLGSKVPPRGATASDARIAFVDSILDYQDGKNPLGGAHEVVYTFSIDVPYHEAIAGDTLRVWMPVPIESQRQSDFKLISTSQSEYIISNPEQSVHHTIYFTAPAPAKGDTAHFEYTASFITKGEYFSPEYIQSHIKPYDKQSELYRKYTQLQAPHIVDMSMLACEIVLGETDPYKRSEMVYDYIISHFPWAGAREYSTIDCIPEYVIKERHGDCGQVALLYISLMRTLGIPARWESGWMLHPGEKNLHDWAEVYFEGVGWVPVDVSFGRYTKSNDARVTNFYSTGMDAHRFVSNKGVCGELYPPKQFIRSETVDFQLGEVECSRGNLFYPAWDQHLKLISVKPVTTN
jgi:transglutaminase-like putative cysteine protease